MLEYSSFLHHYSVQFHHNNNFDNKTQFGRCSFRTRVLISNLAWRQCKIATVTVSMQSEDDEDQSPVLHRYHLQFTVISCSTETQQWSPADGTNHKPQSCIVCIGYFFFFALKSDLIFCMPLVHSNSSRPRVFTLDIREFLLWCISTIYLLTVSRPWLEEESCICCWHF